MTISCRPAVPLEDLAHAGPDEGTVAAIMEAAGIIERRLESVLEGVGLSISKFDAIEKLIQAGEPLTLGDLASELRCVRSNVTQLVDRLEAEGLVKRGACPNDRRAVRAMVTPVGVERHAAGVTAIRGVQAEIARRLGAGDRAALTKLLGRVAD
jgi:DNA-binding MarR family transcriptional regulator